MSMGEQAVNEALRALDEAYRLQRLQRDEYRQRRRALLESLARDAAATGDTAGDTARRAAPSGIGQQAHAWPEVRDSDGARGDEAAATRPVFGKGARAVLLGALAVGVVVFCWFAFAR